MNRLKVRFLSILHRGHWPETRASAGSLAACVELLGTIVIPTSGERAGQADGTYLYNTNDTESHETERLALPVE
ncbi:MAG: hypothetical protein NVS9B15_18760 [Acidobacteriaceae bacterium]